MSIDTRDKRMSLIGLALIVPSVLPNPDREIDAGDREMLLYLCRRFEADITSYGWLMSVEVDKLSQSVGENLQGRQSGKLGDFEEDKLYQREDEKLTQNIRGG